MISKLTTDFSIQTTILEVGVDADGVQQTQIYLSSIEFLPSQTNRSATRLNPCSMLNLLISVPVFVCNGLMSLSARQECFHSPNNSS